MEIYSAYAEVRGTLAIFFSGLFKDEPTMLLLLWSLGIGFFIWLTFFTLQAFGLYTMAKKQGLKHKWMAFLPFLNILCMGRIAGDCRFFNRKLKNAGTYTMVAQIFASITALLFIAAEFYMYTTYGEPIEVPAEDFYSNGYYYWPNVTDKLGKLAVWYMTDGTFLLSIFGLIYEIFMLVLVIAILKKYIPKYYFGLSVLTLFLPMSRCIIFFVVRGREPIDYEAMMRAKREAYMRRQQQYYGQYGDPYNRPYGNPHSPYGNPYGTSNNSGTNSQQNAGQAQPASTSGDPFEEFSTPNNQSGENGETDANDPDGFFN